MKQSWEIKKLGEVCEFKSGTTIDSKLEKSDGEVIYAKVGDMNLEGNEDCITMSSRYVDLKSINQNQLIPVGSIIFPKRGGAIATNKKRRIIQPTIVDLNTMALVPSKIIDKDYLFFWFQQIDLSDLSNGTSIPQINNYSFDDVHISYPKSLSEQQRIVAILDEAFAAIAKAKANTEQNLKNAKELFDSYLQRVFENKGEGWEEKKLIEVCELKPQKKEARDKLKETDLVTFLPMEDLGVLNKEILGVKERQLKDVAGSYTYFADNDVLMAKITPCFENGKIGIARNLVNGIGFGSSEYIVFRTKGEIVPEFLYYFLSRNEIRDEGRKCMSGAVGHKRVSKDWIENYIIPFPKSLKAQQVIVQKLDSLSNETKKLEAIYIQKTNDLEELKKSVLQKAFSGELKTATALV